VRPLSNTSTITQDPRYYDQFLIDLNTESNTETYNSTVDNTTEDSTLISSTENEFEILDGFSITEAKDWKINANDSNIATNLLDVEMLFNTPEKVSESSIETSLQ